jgi:succinate dehydrogenase/fumarate reductase flavoprotein subunit
MTMKNNDAQNSLQSSTESSFDLIIVGAGTAGIPCAIEAANAGVKRILLLEKTNVLGGTLHWTVGHLSAGGTRRQAAFGIEDSPQAHYDDIMRISKGTANSVVTRLAAEEAPKTIDWLESLGFPFDKESPKIIHGHVPYTRARTHYANVSRGGVVMLSLLLPLLEAHVASGVVTIALNHALEELIEKKVEKKVEEKSKVKSGSSSTGNAHHFPPKTLAVTGLRARHKGELRTFFAPAVVLASGGYAANAALFQERWQGSPAESEHSSERQSKHEHERLFSTANPSSQGDGIVCAESIGAHFHNTELHNVSLGGIETTPHSGRVDYWNAWAMVFTSQYRTTREFYVNADGKRFMNEDEPSADVRERAVMAQDGWVFWVVFDERALRDSYQAAEPLVRQWLDADTVRAHAAKGSSKADYCWSAGSLSELGKKIGVDAHNLEQAASRYNACAQAHTVKLFSNTAAISDEFGRTLFPAPCSEAPFYALRVNACSLISFGGLSVNGELQVLTPAGEPIVGLYAAGEILGAAATSGNAFCGGMLITPALSFGRLLGTKLGAMLAMRADENIISA